MLLCAEMAYSAALPTYYVHSTRAFIKLHNYAHSKCPHFTTSAYYAHSNTHVDLTWLTMPMASTVVQIVGSAEC